MCYDFIETKITRRIAQQLYYRKREAFKGETKT